MGSIRSSLFISLDGVIEAPDQWHFDYFNDEMGSAVGELMGSSDATLLGRQTYDEFAGYWPNADPKDPFTAQMNGAQKYVVSNTLTDPAWENSTVIGGDAKAELTKRRQPHPPISQRPSEVALHTPQPGSAAIPRRGSPTARRTSAGPLRA